MRALIQGGHQVTTACYFEHTENMVKLYEEEMCIRDRAYAMYKKGWHVDVLSTVDEGPAYSTEWTEPWLPIKKNNITINYSQ